ncbi:MAG: hypothetical protein CME25_05585 [Gemmatimonadetes bacterium]|nr:hypothetical protein [Gemmatimonadota bacterium]
MRISGEANLYGGNTYVDEANWFSSDGRKISHRSETARRDMRWVSALAENIFLFGLTDRTTRSYHES